MKDTLEQAYESALAVLTAPVSFVEWTTLKVDNSQTPDPAISDDWSPIGLSLHRNDGDYEWEPTREIQSEKYIYVFSRRATQSNETPTLVEELHLHADGRIEAATLGPRLFPDPKALDAKGSPLPEKRQWEYIGTTLRFVRRYRGARMLHYFFASRIPLSRKFVEQLRQKVASWVPAIMFDDYGFAPPTMSAPNDTPPSTFGQWDPNLGTEQQSGVLKVPVLDPITIALHLHLLASYATNDLYEYITPDSETSAAEREFVVKRQQKLVLAMLVQHILRDYKIGHDGDLRRVDYKVSDFVKEYDEQVNHRVRENDRWWLYLHNWYQSDPLYFLSQAHLEDNGKHWLRFVVPMMVCLTLASQSAHGRRLLKAVIQDEQRFTWFQSLVLSKYGNGSSQDQVADKYQVPRELALLVCEVIKEMASKFVELGGTKEMFRVLGALGKFNIWIMVDGTMDILDPEAAAKAYADSVNENVKPVDEKAINEGREQPEGLKLKQPVDEHDLIEAWEEVGYSDFRFTFTKLASFVELVDLTLSLRQFIQDRSAANSITLARSLGDTSAILLEFAHSARGGLFRLLFESRRGISAIAGVFEIISDGLAAHDAANNHDYISAQGSLISLTGAAISTAGLLGAGALIGLSATPFVWAGLVLMAVGAFVRWVWSDTPMDTFLKFCAFGADGGGGEIVSGLAEMKKGDYGHQLEVLINLICRFKIEQLEGPMVRITMGWAPDGAQLMLDYNDQWHFGKGFFRYRGIDNKDSDAGQTPHVSVTLTLGKGGLSLPDTQVVPLQTLSKAGYLWNKYDDIDYSFDAHWTAQMHFTLGDYKFVVPPEKMKVDIHDEPPLANQLFLPNAADYND